VSDLLSIGASGVRAYQGALTTTSENIANAGTEGYVRRSAEQSELRAAGSSLLHGRSLTGNGVVLTGVSRAGDQFRSAEVRGATADLARSEAGIVWLERIEGGLTAGRLDERLASFFNSAQALAVDPSAAAPRAVMLEQASALAASFRATGAAIDTAEADLVTQTQLAMGEVNALSEALARVNAGLARAGQGSSASVSLMDERDRLLDAMSGLVDISASFDAAGRATVRAGGSGGPVLVAGDSASTMSFGRNAEGAMQFVVHRQGDATIVAANGGRLAGLADGSLRIADARAAIDTLAADLMAGVNAVQAGGEDADGNPGAPMFAGDRAATMTLALSDPRGIAAAAPGTGVRGNGNLTALAALRETGGFEARLTDRVSGNAAAIAGRRDVAAAQSAIRGGAVASRDNATGVNLDEEAVNLMRFQQAYQASSRVIQVARDTLQTILDIR
jgi:flagellar hook-associated protein 1